MRVEANEEVAAFSVIHAAELSRCEEGSVGEKRGVRGQAWGGGGGNRAV